METDENSVRRPLVESECTGNCNRSNCGFLLDVNADANMVCVPVDDDMAGENVQLRRGVRERKRTSNGEAQNAKKPRPAAAEEDKENFGAAASIPVLGESGSSKTQTILGRSRKVGGCAFCGRSDPMPPGVAMATHSGRSTERAEHGCQGLGTHGFVCWESMRYTMNLIDHGRNLRASLPSVRAIGDPLYPFCHFY